jgi:hypothetical protein
LKKRDLVRATDTAHQIHQRAVHPRAREQVRAERGHGHSWGHKASAVRPAETARMVIPSSSKTKKWEINVEDYLAREILSDEQPHAGVEFPGRCSNI